jgi:hypothetical protein
MKPRADEPDANAAGGFPQTDDLFALAGDLAGTYRATHSDAVARVDPEVLKADLEQLAEQGYVVLPRLLEPTQVQELKRALLPLLDHTGRNAFEGKKTQRVYGVPEKTRVTDPLIAHPRILALLDRLFLPNYLLSQCQIINVQPGEAAQYLHADDSFYPVPRPRPALSAATIWAIDEFRDDNGATVVVPGSHRWPDGRLARPDDPRVPVVMPAGSVVFFGGTLWHGGGENRSHAGRLAVTCQYCEPWLRTQENYFLAVTPETVRSVSEDMRRMLGYSIYPPFIGMVNGMHPKRALVER